MPLACPGVDETRRRYPELSYPIPEILPPLLREEKGLMIRREALRAMHFPKNGEERQRAQARS